MSQIKASGAQAVIAWSSGTPIATIFRGITEAGISLPVLTTSANAIYAQMKAYADFLPKELYFSVPPAMAPDQLTDRGVKSAVATYLDAFKPIGIRPDSSQALAWDAALIVIDALKKVGTNATATQIRDYIAGLRGWPGVSGSYDFRAIPQRGVGSTNAVVARWNPAKETWSAMSRLGGDPL
jgi:branched-chain amino acid transport system substrate-binding protein